VNGGLDIVGEKGRVMLLIMNRCKRVILCWLLVGVVTEGLSVRAGAETVQWPTPNNAFVEGKAVEEFIQPAASGKVESGMFGCVRNNGSRFHEGIDIKATSWTKKREPKDSVYAALSGKVAYVNRRAGRSSYGKYVVLVHPNASLPIYTLYAHLSEISTGLAAGQEVERGAQIGVMGRTAAGYTIPKERAHLHFEMGLQLTDRFQSWYNKQKFATKNYFGNYNGMNLVGVDPLGYFEGVKSDSQLSVRQYLCGLPTALEVRVYTKKIPDFIRRYPHLLLKPIEKNKVGGWEIEFTWFGLPKGWRPLPVREFKPNVEGDVSILAYSPELLKENRCRQLIQKLPNGEIVTGKGLQRELQKIFGY